MNKLDLPGLRFSPKHYKAMGGIKIDVTDPTTFQPVAAAVAIIHHLQEAYGMERLWQTDGTREEFFDKLMGTDRVRQALQKGQRLESITRSWQKGLGAFLRERSPFLPYP